MNVRLGFVSNSSSSSFVVAASDGEKVYVDVRMNLAAFAEKVVRTMEDLDEYFLERFGWNEAVNLRDIFEEAPMYKTMYEEVEKALSDGKVVLFGDFSSDSDDPSELFLFDNGIPKTPSVDIIYEG